MTPQELIDLDGYGEAEKHLRKSGRWLLTKGEKLERALDGLFSAVEDAHSRSYGVEQILNEEENT